ncbi:MAG TPA: exodeoxyribonuclease VII large subunit [Clostridiales bacterium]|nr:exodeoxyribonuclease VII large subunit [Clostridiales bacterium]
MKQERNVISVSELNGYIKEYLEDNYLLQNIWIRGEVSNYRPNSSGHMYFTLKDETSALRCIMFRGYASKLAFRLENGMKAIVCGNISVFLRDGQYQLYATDMVLDGVGELFMAFEQRKQKLAAEGLFDSNRKKPIPAFPRKIALITSPTGAAIRDMLRILKARYPIAKVLVVPVKVQGAGAAEEIAAGIALVNARRAADLIITGRGGGSLEDLWCFNEEVVARSIAASHIPVISAVGHEPDVTIADFAADLRAATPSNAAELAVPDRQELWMRLEETKIRMTRQLQKRLELSKQRVSLLAGKKVLTSPLQYIDEKRLLLDYTARRLQTAFQSKLEKGHRRFASAAAALDAMSPLKVLGRGYAMAMKGEGRAIRSGAELTKDETIYLRFAKGGATCAVMEAWEEKNHGKDTDL